MGYGLAELLPFHGVLLDDVERAPAYARGHGGHGDPGPGQNTVVIHALVSADARFRRNLAVFQDDRIGFQAVKAQVLFLLADGKASRALVHHKKVVLAVQAGGNQHFFSLGGAGRKALDAVQYIGAVFSFPPWF